jgi:hypothetical protein
MHISKVVPPAAATVTLASVVHVALTFNTSVKVNAVGSLTISLCETIGTSSVTSKYKFLLAILLPLQYHHLSKRS